MQLCGQRCEHEPKAGVLITAVRHLVIITFLITSSVRRRGSSHNAHAGTSPLGTYCKVLPAGTCLYSLHSPHDKSIILLVVIARNIVVNALNPTVREFCSGFTDKNCRGILVFEDKLTKLWFATGLKTIL
jgi:hypothetical protein